MAFEVEDVGTAAVLRLRGELDMAVADEFEERLRPIVEAGGPVVLDLRSLEFMDSNGVRVIVQAGKKLPQGSCVLLHVAPGPIERLLEITRLGEGMNVHVIHCETPGGAEERLSSP
jgi:anti-anti-sigma factor